MSLVGRRIYFEDLEVRRSRAKGVTCRVTLRKGDQSYIGEAEGMENERIRIELAARATLSAIKQAEGEERSFGAGRVPGGGRVRAGVRVCGGHDPEGPRQLVDDRQRGNSGEPGDGERAGGAGRDESLAGSWRLSGVKRNVTGEVNVW